MKKGLFFFLSCLVFSYFANAQEVIMRQNAANGTLVPYYTNTSTLAQVITASAAGDTLYLPSGSFSLGSTTLVIDKRLHIIGIGHYPGTSNVTTPTIIEGDINITSAASNGSMTGVNIKAATTSQYLQFGTAAGNQNLSNYTFTRCCIDSDFYFGYSTSSPVANNITFRECVLTDTYGNNSTNITFEHCIFRYMSDFNSASVVFNYCIGSVTGNYYYIFYDCTNLTVNNSIFSTGDYLSTGSGGITFTNCVINSPYSNTINGVNNVILAGVSLNSIFANFSTSASANVFSYSHDYHLAANSPAYINGVEVGLYGGVTPYKDQAIPFNPHIQNFGVSNGTVTVEVHGQTH